MTSYSLRLDAIKMVARATLTVRDQGVVYNASHLARTVSKATTYLRSTQGRQEYEVHQEWTALEMDALLQLATEYSVKPSGVKTRKYDVTDENA